MDELLADVLDALEELVDVGPFRLGDDVQEDMDGGKGTGLGASDLSSFEEAGKRASLSEMQLD